MLVTLCFIIITPSYLFCAAHLPYSHYISLLFPLLYYMYIIYIYNFFFCSFSSYSFLSLPFFVKEPREEEYCVLSCSYFFFFFFFSHFYTLFVCTVLSHFSRGRFHASFHSLSYIRISEFTCDVFLFYSIGLAAFIRMYTMNGRGQ